MRTSAPSSSSTTSPGSIPEYQLTRGHRPARCFGLRAVRIATSTRSRFARRQAVGERARVAVDDGEADNRAKADRVGHADKADNRHQVDQVDQVDNGDRADSNDDTE